MEIIFYLLLGTTLAAVGVWWSKPDLTMFTDDSLGMFVLGGWALLVILAWPVFFAIAVLATAVAWLSKKGGTDE